ncbi:hypothetical protein WR25_26275 [Diploscapter pachys]|uniref:Uncharacterized protein n=1 Tax=Diploscapter pachys TaxID=2018661 RepID=A0A2A2K561_9BILA|nr:hypothetical protein WR25_26275 [Diploscapter pachys]
MQILADGHFGGFETLGQGVDTDLALLIEQGQDIVAPLRAFDIALACTRNAQLSHFNHLGNGRARCGSGSGLDFHRGNQGVVGANEHVMVPAPMLLRAPISASPR